MTLLYTQHPRPYQLPTADSTACACGLIGFGGQVSAMGLGDWAAIAPVQCSAVQCVVLCCGVVWCGVQAVLALQEPAIAVNDVDAFEP